MKMKAQTKIIDLQKENVKSYTELVSRNYDSKVIPLNQEITDLQNSIQEITVTINNEIANGNNNVEDYKLVLRKLRGNLSTKRKELKETMFANDIDFELKIQASELDRLNSHNKIVDLYQVLGIKVNEVLKVLNQIELYAGGEYYTPPSFGIIKDVMLGCIVTNMNIELAKLHKKDRRTLETKLINRMETLENEKMKKASIDEKYKSLI